MRIGIAAAVVALTLGACSAAAAPQSGATPRIIAIQADDEMAFSPAAITAQPGETVLFRVTNVGKAEHEFMVGPKDAVDADGGEETAEIEGLAAGQTKELSYTFAAAGTYAFACHEPGHFEAGMFGTIALQP
jgi:uncharacterized cupredoxin-like copper-binding protein